MEPDPTQRFSNRADNYARYRPHYPDGVLDILLDGIGLTPHLVIADIGSGTGIATALFLRNGNPVFAVEPNREMRAVADEQLRAHPGFHNVQGTAEATTLPAASMDCIVAAQAFHWFDPIQTRIEFRRILKPGGWVVLMWNMRMEATPFARAYELLLQTHGGDYASTRQKRIDQTELTRFYAPGFVLRTLTHSQMQDYASLKGGLLSASYAPIEGQTGHAAMMAGLERIFQEYQQDGRVRVDYETRIYYGHL